MSSSTNEQSNVMKQNQHYNLNSTPQLAAVQKSFSYIQKAVEEHNADLSSPFCIVDYGCSHGANSLVAIQTITEVLQQKYGTVLSRNQICTVFNDLPTNDWNTLFLTVAKPTSFVSFSLASGKSFYEQILPSNTVQFGYTSTAIHWLSKKACNLSKHCFLFSGNSTDEEMKMWKEQAAEDYKMFLQHRSNELKKGAILLCVSLGRNNSNDTGNLPVHDNLYKSATAVLDEDELFSYNIQTYYRSLKEQIDPLLLKELNFKVLCADLHLLEHPIYEDYCRKNITPEEFIQKYTEFVRSWSESSLLSALRKDRSTTEQEKIVDDFWSEFRNEIRVQGAEKFKHNLYRSYIVLQKA